MHTERGCLLVHRRRIGSFCTLLLGLLMVLWSSVGNTQISVGVPNPNRNGGNNPMPTWFSGTNCEVSGIAGMPNQTYFNFINRVQLLINGTAVWDNVYFIPLVTPIQPLVYFDSTHFNDASQVTVTINAWTNAGATATTSKVATTYNKEYILGNTIPVLGGLGNVLVKGQDAIFVCDISHHTRLNPGDELKLLRPRIITDLPPGTAYFIWSHGTSTTYGDARTNDAAGQWVGNGDVSGSLGDPVSGKTAKHYPSYNFVAMMACDCGANDALAVGFGVATHIGPPTPDRAFVGWEVEIPEFTNAMGDVSLIVWTTALYQYLNNGEKVRNAVNRVEDTMQGGPGQIKDLTGQLIHAKVYGDNDTKVHGVYGGNLLAWYR